MSKHSARELALKVIHAVDVGGAYANIALDEIMDEFRPEGPDRAFLTELSYGTLRRLNTIDWVLTKYIEKPLSQQNPWVRNILRIAVYQIMFLEKIPAAAACNEAVELGKKYSSLQVAGFINGVLRRIVREKENLVFPDIKINPVDHIALKFSHPTWLVKLWLKELGLEETISICKANNQTPATTIRTNLLRITREELLLLLEKEAGIKASPASYAPEAITVQGFKNMKSLPAFKEGYFFVQDEGSMLVAHALRPRPGATVLDVCGAPGGKATHLAELMGDCGRVIVVDIYAHRLALVRENCRRLRLRTVETLQCDGREIGSRFRDAFDYVLVDAPCSGLGVLRHKPDIRWRKEESTISRVATLQKELLKSASACVRPGGVLVYSTCTISNAENLAQIASFLAENTDFVPEDLRPFLKGELDIKRTMQKGYIQLMPYQGLDGFFISRMRRKGG